jgi:exopolyphosphatase/guanosine-5'-triphosphate,3'-diphosphate pyrophosphatase
MKIATVDIGTNTVLMLVADVDNAGRIQVVADEHAIARLGEGVDASRHITPDAEARVDAVLGDYVRKAHAVGAERIVAFGTSAMRDAANAPEIAKRFAQSHGIAVEILEAQDEARWTYFGALSGLDVADAAPICVFDLGGGSAEFGLGTPSELYFANSYSLGCVRMTENFFGKLPPLPNERAALATYVRKALKPLHANPFWRSRPIFVGVAGTVTTVAAIDRNLATFDPASVAGHKIPRARVSSICAKLVGSTAAQIANMPQVLPGRADIISAGAAVLHLIVEDFRIDELIVSERGVRYGVALREAPRAMGKKD